MTSMDEQLDRDVAHQIATKPLEECAVVGVRNMIDGACAGLLSMLGHSAPQDPALTTEYGHRLFEAALKAMRQPLDDVAEHAALAETVKRQRVTIALLHDATIILRNAWSQGVQEREAAIQQATKLIDKSEIERCPF